MLVANDALQHTAVLLALILVIYSFFLLLKLHLLPLVVRHVVETFPLDTDPILYLVNLHQITESGLHVSIDATVPETKLPLSFLWAKLDISTITVHDLILADVLADIHLSDPIRINGKSHLNIKQTLHVELSENVEAVTNLCTRLAIGGQKEMERLQLRAQFTLTVNLMGLMVLESIKCGKTLNIHEIMGILIDDSRI